MSNVVISVENLWKQYRYGTISHATLRKDFQSWWARFRGKEDPNSRIEQVQLTKNQERGTKNAEGEDRFWALRDINFEVTQGEVLGIIGRNGAGKSTLLKILSKVTTPTKGEIKIKGRIASLLEVGTGFHPELTGRENIYLNGAILGMSKAEIKKKFDEIVAFAEVEKFVDTPVKRYSSGMYVRLAFGVAAHLESEILIVDEVLAVGDASFQKKCLGKMSDVARCGRTVLFVSHSMPAIQKLSFKAVWLHNGKIAESGATTDVVESYLKIVNVIQESDRNFPPGFLFMKEPAAVKEDFAITGIELLNQEGSPLQDAGTWSYVCIRIHYMAKRPLKSASVELIIQSEDNVPLIRTSTEPDSTVPLSIKIGRYYADCIFPKFPLAEGEYLVGAGLAIPMIEYICWDDCLCKLKISKRDIFYSGFPPTSKRAFLAAEHHWECSKEVLDKIV